MVLRSRESRRASHGFRLPPMTSHPTTSKDSATSRGDDERLPFGTPRRSPTRSRCAGRRTGRSTRRSGRRTPASRRLRRVATQVLLPRHVPLSLGRRPARRSSGGLHRHRHHLPLPPHAAATTCCTRWAGTPSACPPSSTRFRPACIRRSHDPHRDRQLPPPAQALRVLLRLVARVRHDRRGVLPLDAVDLAAGVRRVVRRRTADGPGRSPSCVEALQRDESRERGRTSSIRPPAAGARPHGGERGGAVARARRRSDSGPSSTASASRTSREQTVNWCPKLGHGAGQRGGHRRPQRARRPSRSSASRCKQWMFRITAYAERLLADLDLVDWPESTRTMQARVDRPQRRRGDRLPARGAHSRRFRVDPRVHDAARHDLRRHVHGARAGASRSSQEMLRHPRPETDAGRASRAYVDQARDRSDVDRMAEIKEKTGVFTGVVRGQSGDGEPHPDLDRRLRPDGLRPRRDHGRARARRARRRVRAARSDFARITVVEPEPHERSSASDGRLLQRAKAGA